MVIYLSNATVMSLLRPRLLAEGRTREAGRKLQTIGPLMVSSLVETLGSWDFANLVVVAMALIGLSCALLLRGR